MKDGYRWHLVLFRVNSNRTGASFKIKKIIVSRMRFEQLGLAAHLGHLYLWQQAVNHDVNK